MVTGEHDDEMNRFEDIARKVAELPTGLWGWVAFAATCAERLLPFYTCYAKQNVSGADNYLTALDYVWSCLGVMRFDPQDAQRLLAECEKTLPGEDDVWKLGCPYADDAAASILYCLRLMLSGDQHEAVWTARRVYEVVDNFVVAHTSHAIDSPEDELEILRHPIIQNELARQLRDLHELQLAGVDLPSLLRVCEQLRQRAESEAVTLLVTH